MTRKLTQDIFPLFSIFAFFSFMDFRFSTRSKKLHVVTMLKKREFPIRYRDLPKNIDGQEMILDKLEAKKLLMQREENRAERIRLAPKQSVGVCPGERHHSTLAQRERAY